MTIQQRPKQADCLAAFLTTNWMIEEDPLPVPTANETTAQAHEPQHHRPPFTFSPKPPPPDLPSGTLQRRNTFSRARANGVGDGSNSSDSGVLDDSLVNSLPLRTLPMLHEHEQEHQNMNRLPSQSHHGRTTLQPSPSCARAMLLQKESASGAGGGGSGSGIPHLALPFAVRPKNEQTQTQQQHRPLFTSSNRSLTSPPPLSRDQQVGGATTSASVRSTPSCYP
jgi:hypothetical protein